MWIYEQDSGRLSRNNAWLTTGYSGAGDGKNNPAMEDIHDVGPLPRGIYYVGAPFDSEDHGPYVLRLTPHADNAMFGRAGFLMHGDSIKNPGTASKGCIIAARWARQRVWDSEDHLLKVVDTLVTPDSLWPNA